MQHMRKSILVLFLSFTILTLLSCTQETTHSFCSMNDSIFMFYRDSALRQYTSPSIKIDAHKLVYDNELGEDADSIITLIDSGTFEGSVHGISKKYSYYVKEHLEVNVTSQVSFTGIKKIHNVLNMSVDSLRIWDGNLMVLLAVDDKERDPYGPYGIHLEDEITERNEDNFPEQYQGNTSSEGTINQKCLAASSESDFSVLNKICNERDENSLVQMINEGRAFVLNKGVHGIIIDRKFGKVQIELSDKIVWVSSEFID